MEYLGKIYFSWKDEQVRKIIEQLPDGNLPIWYKNYGDIRIASEYSLVKKVDENAFLEIFGEDDYSKQEWKCFQERPESRWLEIKLRSNGSPFLSCSISLREK